MSLLYDDNDDGHIDDILINDTMRGHLFYSWRVSTGWETFQTGYGSSTYPVPGTGLHLISTLWAG